MPRIHVVAQHDRHLQARRQAHHFARAGQRVDAARIGNHRDAALADLPRDARHQRRKISRISQQRVGLLLLLQNRHGDLGQVIQREVVERALFHQAHRRLQPVAPEALPVGDADHGRIPSEAGVACCMDASNAKERIPRVSSGSMMASQ